MWTGLTHPSSLSLMGRSGIVVRTSDSQSRGPGFAYSFWAVTWSVLFTPRCHSSLTCMNEYLATDSTGALDICERIVSEQ